MRLARRVGAGGFIFAAIAIHCFYNPALITNPCQALRRGVRDERRVVTVPPKLMRQRYFYFIENIN